jgi:hypothetical protein
MKKVILTAIPIALTLAAGVIALLRRRKKAQKICGA